jgi:hypothetical protein
MALSDEFLDESCFWSPSSRKIAAQEIRSLHEKLSKAEGARDEARAKCAEMGNAIQLALDLWEEGHCLDNFDWGKSFLTAENIQELNYTPGKLRRAIKGNPGQPLMDRLSALERVREAAEKCCPEGDMRNPAVQFMSMTWQGTAYLLGIAKMVENWRELGKELDAVPEHKALDKSP